MLYCAFMSLHFSRGLLAMGPPSGPGGQSGAPAWTTLFPFVLMIAVFYFLIIMPQQKKAKQHAQLLKNLKAGDKIVTNSGIIGVVITVKEKSLSIRSADTKLEILKSAVAEVTERSSETAAA
jgi:preprotein translocase subunit YajC